MNDLAALCFSQERPTPRSCGLRAALNVVAGKWKPLILWHLLSGPQRSGALRRQVGPISEKVFLQQLRQLEADGIVDRALLSEQPLTVAYQLTPRGESFVPILAGLSQWGFEHVVDGRVNNAG
jgi:DNA-binding HxlR family transcriptional regulator